MRVGCGTAAHGLGGGTPPTGCCASGENDKKEAVRECILSAALFFVFIAPVGSLFGSLSFMRKEEGKRSFLLRRMGAGPMALPWGYGGRGAPCFVVPHATCGKTSGKAVFCIAGWFQGQCPWYRGQGALCSTVSYSFSNRKALKSKSQPGRKMKPTVHFSGTRGRVNTCSCQFSAWVNSAISRCSPFSEMN